MKREPPKTWIVTGRVEYTTDFYIYAHTEEEAREKFIRGEWMYLDELSQTAVKWDASSSPRLKEARPVGGES